MIATSINSADDAVLEAMIEQASRLIDTVTGQSFYVDSADATRYFSGIHSRYGTTVFCGNLVSATTIKLDYDGDRTYEITMAATDFDLLPVNATLEGLPYTWIEPAPNGRYSFPTGRRSIQIVGKFGWPSVPGSIRAACEDIAVGAYHRRFGENTSGVATITGAGVVLTPKDMPETAARILKSFMRMP